VRRTAEDHRSTFQAAGLTLTLRLSGEPVWVSGDAVRLVQVLGNLLQNAAKYTPSGGEVTIILDADHDSHAAELRVSDTGIGIAQELWPRLFEPFTQADQGLDRSQGGLGLGLAMVKGLVELHGGSVSAASEGLSRGAEFTARLPLIAPPARH